MQNINDKMLTGAALLFVGAILFALLVQWWLAPAYQADNTVLHQRLITGELIVKPWQLNQLLSEDKLKNVALVLLDGAKFEGAEKFGSKTEVSAAAILSQHTLSFLKNKEKVYILAGDESDALAAAWLLQAKGYTNVYALANNPDFIDKSVLNDYKPRWAQTTAEKARYDYNRFFGTSAAQPRSVGSFAVPTGQPQVKKAAGGC